MRIIITGRHVVISPLLKEMCESKVEKLEKYGHKLNSLHAIFGKEKHLYTVELTLSIPGMTLVGHAKDSTDFLTAMEQALNKLKRQLRRHESKLVEKRRRSVREKQPPLLEDESDGTS